MDLQRVTACASGADDVAHVHATMIANVIQNSDGEIGQFGDHDLFALDLDCESTLFCTHHDAAGPLRYGATDRGAAV